MFTCKRVNVLVIFLPIILLVSNILAENFTVEETSSGATVYTFYPSSVPYSVGTVYRASDGDSEWYDRYDGWAGIGEIYYSSSWAYYNSWVNFDLSGFPSNVCIDSVIVTGSCTDTTEDSQQFLVAHRLDSLWYSSSYRRYYAIIASPKYDSCLECTKTLGQHSFSLGSQAITDLLSDTAKGWTAVGFTSNSVYYDYAEWDSLTLEVYAHDLSVGPAQPVASTASPCSGESYSVSWDPVGPATGYRLFENSLIVYSGTNTQVQLSHVSGIYNYTLTYNTVCGWSAHSSTEAVTVLTNTTVPFPPMATDTLPCTGQFYEISWDSVSGASLYRLYENGVMRYQGGSMLVGFTKSQSGTFVYTVQSGNACGWGPVSGITTVSVIEGPAAPVAPAISDSTPCPNDSFSVTWQSVAGAIAYHLYENNQLVYGGGDTTRSFSYSSGSYGYEIDAFDECGTSARSPVAQAVIQTAPAASPAPMLSTTTPCANATYTVSWGTVSGATIYRLYENNTTVYLGPDTSQQFSYPTGSFSYHMAAGNSCGSWSGGSPSTQVSIEQSPAVPSTPTASTPTPCPNAPYTIHWNSASGASLYRLYENDILVYEGPDTLSQYSYAAGTFIYYVVSGNLCGEWSAQSGARTVSIQVAPSAPAAPSPDIVPPCNGQPFTLSWPPVEGAVGYYLYESDTLWDKVEETLIQLSLADGLYAFTLTAYNSCELFSVPGGETVVSVGDIPPAPDTLFADHDTVNVREEYIVSWNSPGEGIVHRLYENDLGIFSGKEVSLALSQATAGDYIYDLQVCNDCDCSARSNSLLVVVADSTGCCIGNTGNIDGDPGDNTDISDLTYIVNYIFLGGLPPSCWEESDFTLDGATDISDLTYLVDYIFGGGAPPPPCP